MEGELLNPLNFYPYLEKEDGYWSFKDNQKHEFFVKLLKPAEYLRKIQPIKEVWFEVKMGWEDLPHSQKYLKQIDRGIDLRRSDTLAKIYKDELIPKFISQKYSNLLKLKPSDHKRYQFVKRIVYKFPNPHLMIEENEIDNEIILTKLNI